MGKEGNNITGQKDAPADGLITLVVHTEEHALRLKEILEYHDIPVTIEDVVTEGLPLQVPPKKIRIPVSSLALGLKILESGESKTGPLELIKMTGMGSTLLIPVDFSPLSQLAVKVGFFLAAKFDVEPVLLHSYLSPSFIQGEGLAYDDPVESMELEEEVVETDDLRRQSSTRLTRLKNQVRSEQLQGSLPDIRFSTSLMQGVPEQVIQEYCKSNKPMMVVMATRDNRKKGSDLVGSVTAEVIDSCRVPVVTVPENYKPDAPERLKRIVMFCTFTGYDTLVIRWLMRTFDYPTCSIFLLPVSDSPFRKVEEKLDGLRDFFNKTYPTAEFHSSYGTDGKFDDRVRRVIDENDIQLIIVPNKKSSALSRFFRPTLAHKILFQKDIPLLVLPL